MSWNMSADTSTEVEPVKRLAEEDVIRGMHPLTAQRLDLWRLKNFNGRRLPSAEDTYLRLSGGELSGLRLGLLHGKLHGRGGALLTWLLLVRLVAASITSDDHQQLA
jgi:hypothetical protein